MLEVRVNGDRLLRLEIPSTAMGQAVDDATLSFENVGWKKLRDAGPESPPAPSDG